MNSRGDRSHVPMEAARDCGVQVLFAGSPIHGSHTKPSKTQQLYQILRTLPCYTTNCSLREIRGNVNRYFMYIHDNTVYYKNHARGNRGRIGEQCRQNDLSQYTSKLTLP